MKRLIALTFVLMCSSLALAEDPYFSNVRWHLNGGNPHEAVAVFDVNPEVGKTYTYASVGLATLTETCVKPDGMALWHITQYPVNTYSSTYSAMYNVPGEHSAQIKSTNSPSRNYFPACFAPNTLRLDSVNWLAVTLYDLTDEDEGIVVQYPAVRE